VKTELTPSLRLKAGVTTLVLALLFVHHFVFVVASTLPASPLTSDLNRHIQHYVFPYFGQRWNFFAPQPIERTYSLVARGGYTDATQQFSATPWSDVSKPLVDEVRGSRFAPLSLVQLGVANTVVEYMGIVSKTKLGLTPDPNRPGRYMIKSPIDPRIAPLDLLYLTRTAAASLEHEYPHRKFEKIQIAISIHAFPRFDHRFDKDDPNSTAVTFLEWQAMPDVTQFVNGGSN